MRVNTSVDAMLHPLKEILNPAIQYAESGYVVADVIADIWEKETEKLSLDKDCKKIFLPNGKFLQAGEVHYQPQLAETLRRISEEGKAGFYEGSVAKDMIKKLNSMGGLHTLDDFYEAAGSTYVILFLQIIEMLKYMNVLQTGQGI